MNIDIFSSQRHEATMYVYHEESGINYVDFVPTHEPCSIRDTFVKFGLAKYKKTQTSKAIEKTSLRIRKKLVRG